MTYAINQLKRLYHLARGTARPRIRPLGAYPLDDTTLVLRFESRMPDSLADELDPEVRTHVDGVDSGWRCIELNVARIVVGGHQLVRRTCSLTLPRQAREVTVEEAGADGTVVAAMTLDRERIETLVSEFEALACDAASDSRYCALDGAGPATASKDSLCFTAIVAMTEPESESVLDTIESLARQSHAGWTAVIAANGQASECAHDIVEMLSDQRVSLALSPRGTTADAVNRAARGVQGDYALFMRQGDCLARGCLARFIHDLAVDEPPVLAYCDTDHIAAPGSAPCQPEFKPDFDRDLLYSRNYIPTCFAIRRDALADMGRNPVTFEAAWNYELVLKAIEQAGAVTHIARVLCHERADEADPPQRSRCQKQMELEQQEALEQHFERRGIAGEVASTERAGILRSLWFPPAKTPRVSIVIPNKDHVDYLKPCLESIREKAGYPNYEVVVVENNSTDQDTFAYYHQLERDDERVHIAFFEGPFNYSKIINFGVRASTGSLLLLLNNDTKFITDGFLAALVGYFARPEVGVVGPRLLFPDGLVQHAGLTLLESGSLGFLNQNLSPALHQGYLSSLACASSCSAVLGACQMVRRSTFDEVDGYCEDLAVTCNDLDFCWKVRQLGLSVVYTPHVELFHKEFGSRSDDAATREQEEQSTREYELMVQRWPQLYRNGDGFINPNLDQESIYFKLGEQLPL